MAFIYVEQVPKDAVFVSDSQDTAAIKAEYPVAVVEDFDSFFVVVEDGEYTAIWGMYGIVPRNDKAVYRIL